MKHVDTERRDPRRADRADSPGNVEPRSTSTADFPTSWWPCCARPDCCAPARRARSRHWSCRRGGACGAPKRSRAATRRRAGACRSRSPAACWSPTCRRPSRDELFGDGARRRRGRVGAARHSADRSTAASSCRGAGRSAAESPRRHDVRRLLRRRAACAVRGRAAQGRPAGSRHLAHAGPAWHRQSRRGGR